LSCARIAACRELRKQFKQYVWAMREVHRCADERCVPQASQKRAGARAQRKPQICGDMIGHRKRGLRRYCAERADAPGSEAKRLAAMMYTSVPMDDHWDWAKCTRVFDAVGENGDMMPPLR
jgi:hypothetical protein